MKIPAVSPSLLAILVMTSALAGGCNADKTPASASSAQTTTDVSTKVLPQIQGRFVSQNGALRIKAGGTYEMQVDQNVTQNSTSASCTMVYQGTVQVLKAKKSGKTLFHFNVSSATVSSAQGADPALCTALSAEVLAQKSLESNLEEQDNGHLKFSVGVSSKAITAASDSGPYLNNWVKKGAVVDKTEDFLNQSTQYAEREADGSLSSSVSLVTNSITGVVTYDNPGCGFKFNLNISRVLLENGTQVLVARDAEESVSLASVTPAVTKPSPSPSASPSPVIGDDCHAIESALKQSTNTGIGIRIYDGASFSLDYSSSS